MVRGIPLGASVFTLRYLNIEVSPYLYHGTLDTVPRVLVQSKFLSDPVTCSDSHVSRGVDTK